MFHNIEIFYLDYQLFGQLIQQNSKFIHFIKYKFLINFFNFNLHLIIFIHNF